MVSQKNFLIFSILFLIISLSLVSAQQPAPPTQTNVNINVGLQVEFTQVSVFEVGEDHLFNAHVFNISDGLRVDNTTTDCTFHLFNNTGEHQIQQQPMPFDSIGIDWDFNVLGGNFTRIGSYNYLVVCNTTDFGGFLASGFEISPTGEALDTQQSVIILGLILILLFLTAAFLYFGNEIESLPVKIFLIALGSLFLVFTLGFSISVIKDLMILGAVFSGTFVGLYRLALGLVLGGFFGILLYLITTVVKAFHKSRGIEEED